MMREHAASRTSSSLTRVNTATATKRSVVADVCVCVWVGGGGGVICRFFFFF